MATKTIDPCVLDILARATTDGNKLLLPPEKLERKTYEAVNKVIDALGGKWKGGKIKAHLFADDIDPSGMLIEVLETGVMPEKNPLAFFATTDDVADRVAEEAELGQAKPGEIWLEPSCGDGALLKVMDLFKADQQSVIHAVELDPARAKQAKALGVADDFYELDFLTYALNTGKYYHRILMNPPFAIKGNPYAYIDHILAAWALLAPGGVLVSVAPSGITFNTSKKVSGLRSLIHDTGEIIDLPEGSFKASGTGVNTVLVKIKK